jgi:protein TonB
MQRPISHVLVTQRSPERKAASFVAVGALHVGLIAALMAGLTPMVVKVVPHTVDVFFPSDPTTPVAPPTPDVKFVQPTIETVLKPTWTTKDTQPNQINVAHADKLPPMTTGPVAEILPTAAISIAGSHTTPPYPPLSRRLGEEGKVGLRILIAPDGRVSNVEIAHSSGIQRLDDAARDWVRANWLYRPATKDGKAIASQTEAVVVFNLKTARR